MPDLCSPTAAGCGCPSYTLPVPEPLILAPVLLVAVLALSAVAKLRDPRAGADAFVALRLPMVLRRGGIPRLLPYAELALALALLVAPGPADLLTTLASAALMLAYAAVIARALGFREPVSCACFGRLGAGTVSARTLARNLLLVGLGLLAVWDAGRSDASLVSRLLQAPAAVWGWLALALLAGVLGALIADPGAQPGIRASWVGSGRSGAHRAGWGKAGSTRTAGSPAFGSDTEGSSAAGSSAADLTAGQEYVREPIPFGALRTPDGGMASLRELAAQRARLLVFVSVTCPSCIRVREAMVGFAARNPELGVHPVYNSDLADPAALPGDLEALFDPLSAVAVGFGQFAIPSAVLLGADGLLAGGPIVGESGVLGFLADIEAELSAARA